MSERARGDLRMYATPQVVAAALADVVVADAGSAIEARGSFFFALSGGRTPQAAYSLLGETERSRAIDWRRVFIYFSDERCVPPESDDSNYKMAFDSFVSKVALPARNVHRMHGENEPARAARAYAQVLVETMGDAPCFDLILLGMGEDGHTASLFPGTDPRTDEDQLVRAPFVEQIHAHRLTITPLVINNARHVAIAAEGSPKAAALRAVREGPYDPKKYPVQVVAPRDGELSWLVDEAAAAP